MNKWFIQSKDVIRGPLSVEDVQSGLTAGKFSTSDLIWGPAQEEWRQLSWWTSNLATVLANANELKPIQEWHYSVNGNSHGPFSRLELVQALKSLSSMGDVLMWTSGMVTWAPIFEFSEILTEVGVSRREFPRADIIGKAILKAPSGNVSAELINVSEGGFGTAEAANIQPGQIFPVEIHSSALREIVHAKVECRYVSNGIVGFRFNYISMEGKSTLIQYVRKYLQKSGERIAA